MHAALWHVKDARAPDEHLSNTHESRFAGKSLQVAATQQTQHATTPAPHLRSAYAHLVFSSFLLELGVKALGRRERDERNHFAAKARGRAEGLEPLVRILLILCVAGQAR